MWNKELFGDVNNRVEELRKKIKVLDVKDLDFKGKKDRKVLLAELNSWTSQDAVARQG